MIPISCGASSRLITEVPNTPDFNGSCGSYLESRDPEHFKMK
jgi:hypothetical protein